MNAWSKLHNFGYLVYTVGDGVRKNTIADLNTLSIANAEKAVELVRRDVDAVLFIAGGNSSERSPRPTRVAGALTEAQRMVIYIREYMSSGIPVITDCDPEFTEQTGLQPSGNTPENSRNAASVLRLQSNLQSHVSIPAERLHLPRVIGTFRRSLQDLRLLTGTKMLGYPIAAPFDPESDQQHLRSEDAFCTWEWKARMHHLLTGKVLRKEFLREWMSGRNYSHLFH